MQTKITIPFPLNPQRRLKERKAKNQFKSSKKRQVKFQEFK